MKFIFPKNYNFKNKILGFIDYSVAIVNIIWASIIIFLLHVLTHNINIKIIGFIIFCFPVFLLSISGIQGENIVYIIIYISKFILKQKIFFYRKTKFYR